MMKPQKQARRPVQVFTAIVLIAFTGLVGQLGNLTLVQQGRYLQSAEDQRLRSVPLYAPRGVIYDRNGVELVKNRPAYSVFIRYPYYQRPEILQRLSGILGMEQAEIEKRVKQKVQWQEYYDPVRLKDDITPQQYTTLLELKEQLPGVEVEAQAVRVYPNKELASHLLGYVGEINEAELAQWKVKGYVAGEQIGQTGLEAYYESDLRGKPGVREIEINNAFQPLREVEANSPVPGNNLVLTIDSKLQAVAERALDWDMWRIRNTKNGDGPWPNAKTGAVVVMDVKTGAILAMVSRPGFDPNLFATGISDADYQKLQDPKLTPMLNRSVQKAYQPGSTWKMVTSAAALMNGVVGPYETVNCTGVYDKAGHPKDWTPWGHGAEDTVRALKDSCDIYYYEMGYRLGIDRLVDMAKNFGFGAKTGIDIGGEVAGLLPDQATRTEVWEKELNDPWGIGHTVSAAIGQIEQVTPIQLVRYAASLGNSGKLMQPYLVQRITDAQGKTIKEFGPKQMGQVNLNPEYLQVILEGMKAVDGPGGTSDYGIHPLPGIKTAGKTGTAEMPPYDDNGLFVSLVPADDPQIAVAVVIEQAAHGGQVGAVARAIEASYFNVTLNAGDPGKIPDAFPTDMAAVRRQYPVVGNGE